MAQRNESLLNNALDEDFQQMLRPYYLTQRLLFASKYSIRDNLVLPNSRTYYAVVVLVLCLITCTYFVDNLNQPCILNECPLITDMHYVLAHFISCACVIVQTKSAVKLLIIMQGIDKKLKTFGVPRLPYFVKRNWCCTVFMILFFALGISITASNTHHYTWISCVTIFLDIIFDLDVLYAAFIVEFLSSRLQNFSNWFFDHVRNPLNISAENNSGDTLKDLFKIPKEVIEAFTLSSALGQYSVFGYILSTFINSLVTLQVAIGWAKNAKIGEIFNDVSVIYILITIWNVKNFIMVVVLSATCERFYSRIDDIKSNCAIVLNLPAQENASRKMTKNVLRLCNVRFSKRRVCGLFVVDAALPLRLLGLAATYCIVLLQFAFL